MYRDILRKRVVRHLSNVPVELITKETGRTLAFELCVLIDVTKLQYPHFQHDFVTMCKDMINKGDVISVLDYLETVVGTDKVAVLAKTMLTMIKESKSGE